MSTLEQIRVDRRMSKHDLAEATGLSRKQITLIEQGKVRPRDTTLWKLADALRIEPSEVVSALAAGSDAAQAEAA